MAGEAPPPEDPATDIIAAADYMLLNGLSTPWAMLERLPGNIVPSPPGARIRDSIVVPRDFMRELLGVK